MNLISIKECNTILENKDSTLSEKYDVLFHLRSHKTDEAVLTLIKNYNNLNSSHLLKHEVGYILGQMKNPLSIDFLIELIHDPEQGAVVRHEAGEALANFPEQKERILKELYKLKNNDMSLVKSTINIAIQKLENYDFEKNNYNKYVEGNIEPADPMSEEEMVSFLKTINKTKNDFLSILLNTSIDEFIRYRVMYYLRNLEDKSSIEIFCELLKNYNRELTSPLMRHEVCFILGQLSCKANFDFVKNTLRENFCDQSEFAIVRHEAILCYYAIFDYDEFIEKMKSDPCPLVYESAIVCSY